MRQSGVASTGLSKAPQSRKSVQRGDNCHPVSGSTTWYGAARGEEGRGAIKAASHLVKLAKVAQRLLRVFQADESLGAVLALLQPASVRCECAKR